MASGLGKRFGGNKLMAEFGGAPLIARILDATEGIFQQRVVVTRYQEVVDLCHEREIQTILHDLPYRNDTVRLGLEAMHDIDGCLFTPADQPLLRQETIVQLVLSAMNEKEKIWRPSCDGIPGSPVLFPEWAFSELMNLPEKKGGGWIMKKYPDQVSLLAIQDPKELLDVDTREMLEILEMEMLGKMRKHT